MVVFGEGMPDPIFIDVGAERSIDLSCDPWAPKPGIAAFHFNDDFDEFWRRSLRPGFDVLA